MIKRVLDRAGFASRFAFNGVEALKIMDAEPGYGMLLTDYHMPEMDGIELATLIRHSGWRLPLIAITARADPASERAALAAGMDGYLRKPVTGSQLAEALARVRGLRV